MKKEIIKLGVENKNGRIYTKEVFQKAIDEWKLKNGEYPIPILLPSRTTQSYFEQYDLSDVIGSAANPRIEYNIVVADVVPFEGKEEYFEGYSVVPSGIGEISDNREIFNYQITAFMLTNDPA